MNAVRHETGRIARFGVVGIAATAVYAAIYTVLSESMGISAIYANWIAFSLAFLISLFGHSLWTFSTKLTSARAMRFGVIAGLGLAANTGIVYLIVEMLQLRPAAALPFILFVTPALSYLISKFWAFA